MFAITCLFTGLARNGHSGSNPTIGHLLDRSLYYAAQYSDSVGWYADEAYK